MSNNENQLALSRWTQALAKYDGRYGPITHDWTDQMKESWCGIIEKEENMKVMLKKIFILFEERKKKEVFIDCD